MGISEYLSTIANIIFGISSIIAIIMVVTITIIVTKLLIAEQTGFVGGYVLAGILAGFLSMGPIIYCVEAMKTDFPFPTFYIKYWIIYLLLIAVLISMNLMTSTNKEESAEKSKRWWLNLGYFFVSLISAAWVACTIEAMIHVIQNKGIFLKILSPIIAFIYMAVYFAISPVLLSIIRDNFDKIPSQHQKQ